MTRLRLICVLLSLYAIGAVAQTAPIVIDTDAGTDDLMAIVYLLARPGVRIEAITVVNGLAHPGTGARNIRRLLELAGRKEIPVFVGRDRPLLGNAEFPAEWRRIADELPGVDLPAAPRELEPRNAVDYLAKRLGDKRRKVRILALGPLTNIAESLDRGGAKGIEEIVIMGGAVRVPGNLADGGLFHTDNKTAEWNLYIDPLAARRVFRSGVPITLIPLDASNQVPIGPPFLREIEAHARSPRGRFVAQVLASDRELVDQGVFYAWDPLAAVALLDPGVVRLSSSAHRHCAGSAAAGSHSANCRPPECARRSRSRRRSVPPPVPIGVRALTWRV